MIYEGARITSKLLTRDLGVEFDWTAPETEPEPAKKSSSDQTRGYDEVA